MAERSPSPARELPFVARIPRAASQPVIEPAPDTKRRLDTTRQGVQPADPPPPLPSYTDRRQDEVLDDHTARLDGHEGEIGELRTTLRLIAEDMHEVKVFLLRSSPTGAEAVAAKETAIQAAARMARTRDRVTALAISLWPIAGGLFAAYRAIAGHK